MLFKLRMTPEGGVAAIARMFAAADVDKDGRVSFSEFVAHIVGNSGQ